MQNWQVQFKKFRFNSWPPNWDNLTKKNLVTKSFLNAPYFLRVAIIGTASLCIISLIALFYSTYIGLTVVVADEGGQIREALVNPQLQRFNPVLPLTEAEKKVASLLFLPLYEVSYPDYLNDTDLEPVIKPILIKEEPTWITSPNDPTNEFYGLRFELRDDIFWTDGSAITTDDVSYTFELLKEKGASNEFNQVFANYDLIVETDSQTIFEIRPINDGVAANPNLKYLSNFRPVSRAFYQSLQVSRLLIDLRSTRISVTSGYYSLPNQVTDPDNSRQEVENPILNENISGYSHIVLEKNPYQNDTSTALVDRYIFDVYDQLEDAGGQNNSLERAAKEGKVDVFSRFVDSQSNINSTELKTRLGLEQDFIPTNTFFNVYLNIQTSSGALAGSGYFINNLLRKYVVCNLVSLEWPEELQEANDILPEERRIMPIQFTQDHSPECENAEAELIGAGEGNLYSIDFNERSGIRRVKLQNSEIPLKMVGLAEFENYGINIENKMKEIGLPVNTRWLNAADLNTAISSKNYHLIFVPITIVSRNPYPIYGLSGQNLSNISRNNRVDGRAIETALEQYSNSNLNDLEAKETLEQFFRNEYISVNYFRGKMEVNYNKRVLNFQSSLPEVVSFTSDIYNNLPSWYTNTKRKFRF